jgi:hypothetical protein
MPEVFYRKKFSYYLGEQRAIDDIVLEFIPVPSPTPTPNYCESGITDAPLWFYTDCCGTYVSGTTLLLSICYDNRFAKDGIAGSYGPCSTSCATPTPTPTPSITPSVTPTITPTTTTTSTPTNTPTTTITATPTNTGTPTVTPTNTQTETPTNTPTTTPTNTPTNTGTPTVTPTNTQTETPTNTPTTTPTNTPTTSVTPTQTNTPTITPTPSETPCICETWELEIFAEDFAWATGNTINDLYNNSVVLYSRTCGGSLIEDTFYTEPGIYQVCVDVVGSTPQLLQTQDNSFAPPQWRAQIRESRTFAADMLSQMTRLGCCVLPTPTPTTTNTATPTTTPTTTPTNTPTNTGTPTNTPTPSVTPGPILPTLDYHLNTENSDNILTESGDYLDINISLTSQYITLLNYANTQGYTLPSVELQREQNNIIQGFLDAGLWDDMDTFYVFINNDPTLEQFSRLNWITPSAYTITTSGTTNYGISGYTFNGTNQYLNTNYIPSVNAVNYSLNSCSRFIYKCDTDTDDSVLDGNVLVINNSNNTNHMLNRSTSSTTCKVNRASEIINSFQDCSGGAGLILCGNELIEPVGPVVKFARNASGGATEGSGAGNTLPTNSQLICRVGNSYGTHVVGVYGIGNSSSYYEYTTYNNIITNYINNII